MRYTLKWKNLDKILLDKQKRNDNLKNEFFETPIVDNRGQSEVKNRGFNEKAKYYSDFQLS